MIMSKKRMSRISMALVLCLTMVFSTQMVFATNGLNGVGENTTTVTENVTTTTTQGSQNVVQNTTNTTVGNTTTSQPTTTQPQQGGDIVSSIPNSTQNPQDVENTANAVSGMFGKVGPKEKDVEWANAFIEPIADIMNKVMAVILGVTSLLMMFTTMLDLLYLAFPPVRDYLDGGRQGMANMMGAGGAQAHWL